MTVHYFEEFVNLLKIPNYPLTGFIGKLSRVRSNEVDPSSSILIPYGDPYYCNTFLTDNGFSIQFDASKQDIGSSTLNRLTLFYIDRLLYPHYSLNSFKVERNDDIIHSQCIACNIIWDNNSDEFSSIFSFNEIFRLPYPNGTKPNCSFIKLNEINRNEVSHYNDYRMGQTQVNSILGSGLMSSGSGKYEVRKKLSDLDNVKLSGRMIIKPNGIIQI